MASAASPQDAINNDHTTRRSLRCLMALSVGGGERHGQEALAARLAARSYQVGRRTSQIEDNNRKNKEPTAHLSRTGNPFGTAKA